MYRINSILLRKVISIIIITSLAFTGVLVTPAFAYATPVSDSATHNLLDLIDDKLDTIKSYIATLINYFSPLSGDNLTIAQQLLQIRNLISAVGSQTADVSSKLVTTNNHLYNISNYTDGLESSLSTINSNLVLYTEHVQGYLHDVSWRNNSVTYLYSVDGENYYSFDDLTISSSNRNLYIKISSSNNESTQYLSYLRIPFTTQGDVSLDWNFSSYHRQHEYTYASFIGFKNIDFFILPFNIYPTENYPTFVHITFTRQFSKTSSAYSDQFYKYLTPLDQDYYEVQNIIYNYNQSKVLDNFKELYASDDLIEAKENQQSFEDSAISTFTGNGLSSASVSDIGSMSTVSNTLKSGLNGGGTVSGGLSVFQPNEDFWQWFSQSNYNDINTLYNPNNTRSVSSRPEVIDFIHNQENDLERALNEYR